MTCSPVAFFNGLPVGVKGIAVNPDAENADFKKSRDALVLFGERGDFLTFAGFRLGGDLVFEAWGFSLFLGALFGVFFAAVGSCLGGDLVFETCFAGNFGVTTRFPLTAFAAFFFAIHPHVSRCSRLKILSELRLNASSHRLI